MSSAAKFSTTGSTRQNLWWYVFNPSSSRKMYRANLDAIQEHYADGDLVNSETPVAEVQAGPQALSIWGPPVPEVF